MTETKNQQLEILDYWFAAIGDGFDVREQHKIWYGGKKATDDYIRQHYTVQIEQAVSGKLAHWSDTSTGALALVLLLDQFTRNVFRGTEKAFTGDSQALAVVKKSISDGLDTELSIVQRSFFYMPVEHSERLQDQDLCIKLFEKLLQETPVEGKSVVESSLNFAHKHQTIIQQFGRFPHRNELLNRVSTAEEQAFLAGGGARFGQ